MKCANYWWVNEKGKVIGHNTDVTVKPNKTTTYTLVSVTAQGCLSEDQVTVFVSNRRCLRKRLDRVETVERVETEVRQR